MHAAITADAPTDGAETVPTLPYTVLVAPDAVTETGFDEYQVRGTPTSVMPMLSITVALSVVDEPLFTMKELLGLEIELIAMDWTRQVSTCAGWLLIPLAEAKIVPRPGVLAVTVCWFKGDPSGSAVRETMFVPADGATCCQEKGPTVEVMSVVPLNADA